jgi:hypothetical protein
MQVGMDEFSFQNIVGYEIFDSARNNNKILDS